MKSRYFVSALILGVLVCSSAAFAQRGPGGRGRGGPGFGGPGFGGGSMFMLMNEQIREELEIVPDQLEKLQKIGEQGREGMREMFSGMRDLNEEERRAKWEEIRAKMEERRAALQEEIDNVLLPHQKERLDQIQVQMRMRGGAGRALGGDFLAEKLGITDAQKEQLEKVREEVEAELQKKMAEIRAEAEEKILGVLTATQKAQLEKLRGEPFEFQFGGRDGGRRGGPRPGGDGGT